MTNVPTQLDRDDMEEPRALMRVVDIYATYREALTK